MKKEVREKISEYVKPEELKKITEDIITKMTKRLKMEIVEDFVKVDDLFVDLKK